MKPVVIARFFTSPNFILQSQNDGFGICNLEWFHSTRKSQIILTYTQLLMTQCLTWRGNPGRSSQTDM